MPRTITASGSQARLILIGTAVLLSLGMGIRQSLGLFLTPEADGRSDRWTGFVGS
jgi:hypothetical protein